MVEKIKREIIFLLIFLTLTIGIFNVSYGVYFGVLTNVLINAFWNSKLFPQKVKPVRELITGSIAPKL